MIAFSDQRSQSAWPTRFVMPGEALNTTCCRLLAKKAMCWLHLRRQWQIGVRLCKNSSIRRADRSEPRARQYIDLTSNDHRRTDASALSIPFNCMTNGTARPSAVYTVAVAVVAALASFKNASSIGVDASQRCASHIRNARFLTG